MIAANAADPTVAAYRQHRDEASLRVVMAEHLPALRATVRRVALNAALNLLRVEAAQPALGRDPPRS